MTTVFTKSHKKMPKIVDIDQGDLIDLIQDGLSPKEMAGVFDCSIPTVRSKINQLLEEEGIWTKYRDIQNIALTKMQFKILEAVTDIDIEEASLQEKVNAFRVLKDKELVASGKPTEIKGLLGYLVEAEKKEKRIKERQKFQEAEVISDDSIPSPESAPTPIGQTLTKSRDPNDPDYIPAI